ncbi:methyltransferase domain-containing protein [Alphaproteobacteria bacterium]|nr:methyltransferase domain-containing protein [Alphaproteobacteria bacterium]
MTADVTAHYSCNDLIERINADMKRLGLTRNTITRADLSRLDEFHVGGHGATCSFLDNMPPLADGAAKSITRILDIGCGIGGPARYIADHYGVNVTGVDLSPDYLRAGTMLNDWVGLAPLITLAQGSATDLPPELGPFDAAIIMHLGMNIRDKLALFKSAFRVLRPGGYLGIYDVMKQNDGMTTYPLPWAKDSDMDASAAPAVYHRGLERAGFTITSQRDRSAMALAFFAKILGDSGNNSADNSGNNSGPAPLGLHILMGRDAKIKISNIASQIASGLFAPTEIIAQKPALP